jgi:aldose 1-epimerase
MSADVISLAHGDYRLEILPRLGGCVGSFTHRQRHLLRPTAPGVDDAFQSASFPLVPYANRIADGLFLFHDREVRIPRNARGQAHPLHGHSWHEPWRVAARSDRHAVLTFLYEAGSWPWTYSAEQALTVSDSGLRVDLTLTNRDSRPMPAGLGWHPYFPRTARTWLQAEVRGAWEIDEDFLPTTHVTGARFGDWTRGEIVERPDLVDNCHTGWAGSARILLAGADGGDIRLTMSASEALRWLHIYVPVGKGFFCVEPVSHMPNAVNRPEPPEQTGLVSLEPGSSLSAWIQLGVAAPVAS